MKGYPYVTGIYHKCHIHNPSSLIDCFCNHSNVSMIVFGCGTLLADTAEILKNQKSHIYFVVFVDLSVHT